MSDEGRLVAGRYRISRRIGTGAMGAVWQAHDELLGRTVAIKQLMLQPGLEEVEREEARQRTMREGRIAARLHHQNAITVFDVVTDDRGQPCLIMEYLESTSLAAVLQSKETLPPLEVARIGAQIAAALKVAHRVGVVHRDIKPGNILLDRDGMVKITDFGISRAKDDVTVTKTGMIAGTPAYLAPEVAIGEDPGPESDIFSLGSTLYAATEGQPPFGLSENTLGLLHAVAAGHINPPRRSGPLTSVLAVLLHPEKERRPDAEETEELLEAVARGETPLGGPVESDPTAMVPAGALAGGALAGGALGAGAVSGALDEGYDDQYHDRYDEEYDDYDPLAAEDDYLDGRTEAMGYPGEQDPGYPDEDPDLQRTSLMSGTRTQQAPPPPPPAEDEDDARRGWAKPAAAALLVVGGVTALALYLSGGGEEPTGGSGGTPTTSSSARPVKQSTKTSEEPTTTTTSEYVEPQPPDLTTEQPEPEDEPTAEPEPDETTTTTTKTTTTTTTPPPSSSSSTPDPGGDGGENPGGN
ncbi:MAG: serine/threonine-protein kinase [Thermocrispum sp.]